METTCRVRSLANVKVHELDLMKGELPDGQLRFRVVPLGRVFCQ